MISPTTEPVYWTTRDLEWLPQNEGIRYEIIGGTLLVTRSPHRRHQQATGKIFRALAAWSEQTGLGEAIPVPGVIFSEGDNVIPDVVWVIHDRLAAIEDEAGHLLGAPDLVVEVLSPGESNSRRDREAKLKLYSIQGVQEYWIADPVLKQVAVYRRDDNHLALVQTLLAEDELTSPLLPEFRCLVQRFFA